MSTKKKKRPDNWQVICVLCPVVQWRARPSGKQRRIAKQKINGPLINRRLRINRPAKDKTGLRQPERTCESAIINATTDPGPCLRCSDKKKKIRQE